MNLDLGTLTGYLSMDDSGMDKVLDALPGKLGKSKLATNAAALLLGAGIGVALGQGLANAVSAADATAKLTAELGLTEAESARIGDVAGRLYAQAYGDSVQSVSDAVTAVVSSIRGMRDASDETVEAMTAKVLNFGTTFETDVNRVTQVVGQMLTTGLVSDADEAMDLLTSTFQRVPKAVREDILDAADEYGPFFAGIGIDGRTAFGILEQASAQGMYGIDKTGDALKEFSIRATDMSKSSVDAYDLLGLSAEEMSARLIAGGEEAESAFAKIVHALQGVEDPVTQANAAIALFGTPLEDLGVQEIQNFLGLIDPMGDAFDDAAGSADRMGEAIQSGPSAQLLTLQRRWESVVGTLGQRVLPILIELTDWALANPGVMSAVAIGLGILAAAFIGVSVATWAMNTALLANPITWIILGIVALVGTLVWLIANWDSVVSFITDAWGGFTGWLGDSLASIGQWFADAWATVTGGVASAWSGIIGGVQAGWGAVMAWIQGIPAAVVQFFANAGQWLINAGMWILQGLATGIALAIVGVHYLFTQFPADLVQWMTGAGVWLITTGREILVGLAIGIAQGYLATVAWFEALPGRVLAFLISAGTWLVATGRSILNGMAVGIATGWVAVSSWFQALPGRIFGFLVSSGVWLVSTGRSILSGLASGIVGGWSAVVSFFQNLPSNITRTFVGAGLWLYSAGRDIVNGLLNGVRSLGSTIGSFFLGLLPGWIVGPFKAALGIASPSKLFRSFGRNLPEGLLLGVEDGRAAIEDTMANLVPLPSAPGMGGAAGAGGPGAAGATIDRSVRVYGNVIGGDAQAVARELREIDRQEAALQGLDDLVVVA